MASFRREAIVFDLLRANMFSRILVYLPLSKMYASFLFNMIFCALLNTFPEILGLSGFFLFSLKQELRWLKYFICLSSSRMYKVGMLKEYG